MPVPQDVSKSLVDKEAVDGIVAESKTTDELLDKLLKYAVGLFVGFLIGKLREAAKQARK